MLCPSHCQHFKTVWRGVQITTFPPT
jgi:hypothetical protein